MNMQKVGAQIAHLRRSKGLTQEQLGARLNVTFQAVSKWERGESLPDTAILIDLANALETTVDFVLRGGEKEMKYSGKVAISTLREGLQTLEQMGKLLGHDTLIYRLAIQGINEGMNTDVEAAFASERVFECFLAEAALQNLSQGMYIDPTDVRRSFKDEHFRTIVLDACKRCGIG